MQLPIGLDDKHVARLPVVTLAIAALSLFISASVAWHGHLTRSGTWFESVNAYWQEHPDMAAPDACAQYMTAPPKLPENAPPSMRVAGDSQRFNALCLRALDERATNQPIWLVRADQGLMQIGSVTHGLAFPNLASALIGMLLLVFGLGALLEDRWGRDRFVTFWILASVVTAIIYRRNALPAAEPLAGGNALSAACLGAFAATFGKQRFRLNFAKWKGPVPLAVPAWTVTFLWVVAHIAVLALTEGRTPADSSAEWSGFAAGLAVGVLARFQRWRPEGEEADAAKAEPAWVKANVTPPRAPHETSPAAKSAEPAAPMFDDVQVLLHPPRVEEVARFEDLGPVSPQRDAAPAPVPLETDGGWARFQSDEPVLPAKVALPIVTAPAAAALTSTATAFSEALDALASGAPTPDPSPFPTAFSAPTPPEPLRPSDAPTIPYWTLIARDAHGIVLRDDEGALTRVNPRKLLAVAVGVVKTVDQGAPGPALIFDLVLDRSPPQCIRVRPSAEVLEKTWPNCTRQDAVLAMARELASGGAIRVPQVPEWPGPPWSSFPDTRTLQAAWQRALAKR